MTKEKEHRDKQRSTKHYTKDYATLHKTLHNTTQNTTQKTAQNTTQHYTKHYTTLHKTLHKKIKIEQHALHYKLRENSGAPEVHIFIPYLQVLVIQCEKQEYEVGTSLVLLCIHDIL